MTSSVTSSYSADGLRDQTQESADSAGRLCIDYSAVARTSRKLCIFSRLGSQAQRIEEITKRSSRSDKPAAKKLTIYESWMSTAEINSNGESDKNPAKEKDTISHTVEAVVHLRSLGVLTAAGCGIGSVHAVVRSNLLVEPSEVEEGEM
ncbi:GDSL esterase/lipase-like [Dorcoceras hygrometricum]|uniref:GDSL esterase/lipase-like n=1 Tax=Dorcoceras hygrometricum TaxID=472368 RepID=A0A2Z7D4R1_9LAMI|nr:GDSL esterase/lipase-like [Dorcoceras hygrometricum]